MHMHTYNHIYIYTCKKGKHRQWFVNIRLNSKSHLFAARNPCNCIAFIWPCIELLQLKAAWGLKFLSRSTSLFLWLLLSSLSFLRSHNVILFYSVIKVLPAISHTHIILYGHEDRGLKIGWLKGKPSQLDKNLPKFRGFATFGPDMRSPLGFANLLRTGNAGPQLGYAQSINMS